VGARPGGISLFELLRSSPRCRSLGAELAQALPRPGSTRPAWLLSLSASLATTAAFSLKARNRRAGADLWTVPTAVEQRRTALAVALGRCAAPSRRLRVSWANAAVAAREQKMTTSKPASTRSASSPRAGLKGLHGYQVALEFYRLCLSVTRKLPRSHASRQLLKAAESSILNIAEAYPTFGADRARRFRTAGDEASECGAALDILELRGDLAGSVLVELRSLNDRLCAMLWRLGRLH
jgi:four helix bundle protein